MTKMNDELRKDFSEATAPANTFAGAAGSDFSTYPAVQETGETPWPRTPLPAREYLPLASNLPLKVSAEQVARESLDRTYNMGPGDRSPLAGTTVEEGDN